MRRSILCLAAVLAASVSFSLAFAQFGGSRAGVEENSASIGDLPRLERDVVEGFIAIDGRAEVRVRPTEIRIVLAVTSEGQTAQECQKTIDETIGKLQQAWTAMRIPAENIVVDFIAVLPRYEWFLEKRGEAEVGVEKKVGFHMQTNVHLAVPNDAIAPQAFARAFELGVTDIIAFDYWSRDLDDVKVQARELAIKAARSKSDLLLGAIFEDRPPVINVQEQTAVRYPESLYHAFVNTVDEGITHAPRRDVPYIRAHRPRNTYYRGLFPDADIQAQELPMKPEISVISSVRLYFKSPAAKRAKKD